MKKVLIAHNIHVLLDRNHSFLNRTDVKLLVATTSDKALKTHLKERMDLIITELDMPGMPSEQFCSLIRKDHNLRAVSIIMVCEDNPEAAALSRRCGVNAVLTRPVHPIVLMEKAQSLLDIAARGALRVVLSATVDGRVGTGAFSCRTRNISSSGMLIESPTPLEPGALLSCRFWLFDEQQVQASCRIVRTVQPSAGSNEYQYGVMFTDISPETRNLIGDFVEQTAPKSRGSGS